MNFFEKFRKNIIQPLKYHWLAFARKMPAYAIHIGNTNVPIVQQWHKTLTTTKFLIFNKTIALAMIDLTRFILFDDYINSVRGKNSVNYYRNRAIKKGFIFAEINLNDYVDDIYEINTSAHERGGRPMTSEYLTKENHLDTIPQTKNYGVFEKKKLVAYISVLYLNEVAFIDKLLGHKLYLDDGIMYLLIANAIEQVYESNKTNRSNVKYVIYDSFITNGKGLTFFKKRFGFVPAYVKWKSSDEK